LLTPPPAHTRIRHLSLDAFPQAFQDEIQAYLEWASRDSFAEDAPPQTLRATTRRLRREQLRIAASILAGKIGGPQQITGIGVLVQPAHVRTVLTQLLDEAPDRRASAFTRGIAVVLSAVARHWCKQPADELEELRRIRRGLGKEPKGLTAKNRTVLRQLEDERTLAALLALPESLMRDVKTRRMTPARRLQRVEIALAISLLQVAPMRLQNLTGLRLDQHLQWPAGRSGTVYITFADTEVKNEESLDYPISGQAKEILHTYLDHYRPIGDTQKSPWLFLRRDGNQMTAAALRDGISKAIKRATGLCMTPHMFRHLAAMLYLDAHPGALGGVRDLLGHRSVRTTERFYAGRRTRQAALEFDRIIESARNQVKVTR
jgi:integrase